VVRHRNRHVAALVLGVVALVGASLTASTADAADPAAGPAADPAQRGPLPVPEVARVGTFNINASQTYQVWTQAVSDFMPMVDVAGLQEVNKREKTAWLLQVEGWGSYRPAVLQQNPVIWDESEFELVEGRGEKIANGRQVEVKKPGADAYEKDAYATVVRLRHVGNGQTISVVNLHLISGAVNNGKKIAAHPKLYRLYVDEVAGARKVIAAEQAWAGGRVYVVGDFNNNYPADRRWKKAPLAYAQLTALGLTSAWESRPILLPGQGSGTRGGSYLDNLWSRDRAVNVAVKRTFHVSDHYPVVATYTILPPVLRTSAGRRLLPAG
jgi:endonuclease/exonuclease/phosphatase family metal-dependent hydrolase